METRKDTPFQQMITNIFLLSIYPNNKTHEAAQLLDKIVVALSDNTLNYTQEDQQLFRELHCGRINIHATMIIYNTLVKNRAYIMTSKDMGNLVNQLEYTFFK